MRKEMTAVILGCTLALILASAFGQGTNYTSNARQGSGNWDSGADGSTGIWSPGAHTATGAVAVDPAATFELLTPGARLRTTILVSPPPDGTGDPYTATPLVFPGNLLTIDGDGIYRNGASASAPIAEVRFKSPAVLFPKIVMNGGIWDQGDTTSSNRTVSVHGEVNVNGVNFPIYNDGGADRGFNIDWLTGSGNIEFRAYTDVTIFKPAAVNSFLLLGSSNTYSGTWNVVLGVVLGYGSNSLGTNSITVGPGGALESGFDIYNPAGNLILNGQLFLHQNDTFLNVIIGGTNVLAPGTYTAAQLSATYSNNFPATWTQHLPSTFTTSSGSLTVLTNTLLAPTRNPNPLTLGTGLVPETANFSAAFAGQAPISYQWKKGTNSIGTFTNIIDGPRISGATSTSLTINNVVQGDSGFFLCFASNAVSTAVSAAAQLTVVAEGGVSNFTMSANQALGSDWDTPGTWNVTNSATYLAAVYPGSTFEVLPGGNLRTPNAALDATFPIYAGALQIDGDGVFANPAAPHIGTLQFKNASNGRVAFNKLVMNGGQLNNGQDGSSVTIDGEMDVLTNTPIFEPGDSGTGDRGFRITAWLTGTGAIEAHLHVPGPTITQPLNILGTSNTFSGKWNIVNGALLGTTPNCLGPNDIIAGDDFAGPGALETLYDINNPAGSLIIEGAANLGQVWLHQSDAFMAVRIAGTYLTNGVYTFDVLNAMFPNNFPLTWVQQVGSTNSTALGSITVLGVPLAISKSGPNLQLTWPLGTLLEATSVSGPWTTNAATSPYIFPPVDPMKYYRIIVQ
jgi:hypothetical protein